MLNELFTASETHHQRRAKAWRQGSGGRSKVKRWLRDQCGQAIPCLDNGRVEVGRRSGYRVVVSPCLVLRAVMDGEKSSAWQVLELMDQDLVEGCTTLGLYRVIRRVVRSKVLGRVGAVYGSVKPVGVQVSMDDMLLERRDWALDVVVSGLGFGRSIDYWVEGGNPANFLLEKALGIVATRDDERKFLVLGSRELADELRGEGVAAVVADDFLKMGGVQRLMETEEFQGR